MRHTFDATPDAPTHEHRQYCAMLASRAIWEDGRKAGALPAPIAGKGHFDQDQWEFFHTGTGRGQGPGCHDTRP